VAVPPVTRSTVRTSVPGSLIVIGAVALATLGATSAGAAAGPGSAGMPLSDPGLRAAAPAPPIPGAAPAAAEDLEPKLSLPVEADREAWQRSGFRLGLGLVYGQLFGIDGAPSGRLLGAYLRLGIRLDRDWSVYTTFQYALASAAGGLSGLRFAGTLDPTWHVTPHLSLAVGLGFGGIVEGSTSRPDIDPLPSTLDTSYTFPGSNPPLPSCSGVGVAGLARAEWAVVLGPRSSTNFIVEATGQWTECVADTGRVEPDTGQAIVRRQFWPHAGLTAAWGISWR
jgi:hypothetical protein